MHISLSEYVIILHVLCTRNSAAKKNFPQKLSGSAKSLYLFAAMSCEGMTEENYAVCAKLFDAASAIGHTLKGQREVKAGFNGMVRLLIGREK